MAANAPYYQMRAGQFTTTPKSTNATPSRLAHDDAEYELSVAAAASSHVQTSSSYTEHTASQNTADIAVNTMEENHNLTELLEAATTAAGQASQAMDAHDTAAAQTTAHDRGKRKRASSSPVPDPDAAATPQAGRPIIAPKRRRLDVPTDPQLQNANTDLHNSTGGSTPPQPQPVHTLLNDARAAGVHSAAALFRRSTEKTARKYTRPPMSKLFMSLQLSPENFLQLQAQAKTYMLDTAYPERQNCVGNRGKGDTDMVKLRLFNCVRDFLNHGVGEEFFGENVEKPGERDAIEAARALGEDKAPNIEGRLTWSRDGNKIISLVTPLMRRMVTNERQRMYAIETRKGGSKKIYKDGSAEAMAQQTPRSPSGNSSRGPSVDFDLSLARPHTSQPASPTVATAVSASPNITNINIFLVIASNPSSVVTKLDEMRITSEASSDLVNYPWASFLNGVTKLVERAKGRQAEPKLKDLANNLQNMAAAANAIQGDITNAQSDTTKLPRHIIKTIGPNGWEVIDNAEQWHGLLLRRGQEVWVDGIVNMIVELVDIPVRLERDLDGELKTVGEDGGVHRG